MNRATRDKLVSSASDTWQTPPAVFDQLNRDFGPFDIDVCADSSNHLLPTWFGPGSPFHQDAITADWAAHGRRSFINLPYGSFVQRLLPVAQLWADRGHVSVLLLPMRVTRAFREHIIGHAAQLLFCDKRITFYEHGQPRLNARTGKADPALFDSIIVVFDGPANARALFQPRVGIWNVPKHT